MTKRILLFPVLSFFVAEAMSQYPRFSIATDLGIQRNFKKEQRYWAIGQTVHALFHIAPKDDFYVWFCYYTNGNFKNEVTATAKAPFAIPRDVVYINRSKMRLKQFSVGWKKYLVGTSDAEKNWNLYGYGGFGLLLGRIQNTHSRVLDTTDYIVPVLSGQANFKRLTVDLGVGFEVPVGGDFFLYTEGRAWVPTTDYPSKYILVNDNAPFVAMLGVGLRLLF